MSNLMLMSGGEIMSSLPFMEGGNKRYIYKLCPNGYTAAVPTTQYVAIIDTADDSVTYITLAGSKNFSSIFYRAVDETVHVVGNGWVDVIDVNPASGTFHTITASRAWSTSSASYIAGSYLPYPFDFWSTGGAHAAILGGGIVPNFRSSDGRYEAPVRLCGHSNTQNMIYYHLSQVLSINKSPIKVLNTPSENNPNVTYSFMADPQTGIYNDLQAVNFPVYRFGNFLVVSTNTQVYVLHKESLTSHLLCAFITIAPANRSFQCYCPNAPLKLFFADQITVNQLSVVEFDYANKRLNDLGDLDRAAYKDTNESGCDGMIYSPYSGKLYVFSGNNLNVASCKKVHIYDPTLAVGSMYQSSLTLNYEFKSENRASVSALNTQCQNGTPIWEYPDVLI